MDEKRQVLTLLATLWQLERALQRWGRERGVRRGQNLPLLFLLPCSVTHLQYSAGHANASQTMQVWEEDGIVVRRRLPRDRRVTEVRLTPKGEALREELEEALPKLLRAALGGKDAPVDLHTA